MSQEKQTQKKNDSKWKQIYIKECRLMEIVSMEVNIKYVLLIYFKDCCLQKNNSLFGDL